MASFIALPAFDSLSRTWLGALFGVVALLLTVPAGIRVDTLLRTITRAVTLFSTVNALDSRRNRLLFDLLLFAMLRDALV